MGNRLKPRHKPRSTRTLLVVTVGDSRTAAARHGNRHRSLARSTRVDHPYRGTVRTIIDPRPRYIEIRPGTILRRDYIRTVGDTWIWRIDGLIERVTEDQARQVRRELE